jgi:hypothetical protein
MQIACEGLPKLGNYNLLSSRVTCELKIIRYVLVGCPCTSKLPLSITLKCPLSDSAATCDRR